MTLATRPGFLSCCLCLATFAGWPVLGWAQGKSPTPDEKPHLRSVEATPTPSPGVETKVEPVKGKIGPKERKFMAAAARGGLMEIEMGRQAQKQAKSTEIRRIGGKIAGDHTRAHRELMAIAAGKGVDLSKEKPKVHPLGKADFDREYLAAMVKDHEQDIKEFETAAKEVTDLELREYAEKTLPILKSHLELVKKAQERMK